MTGPSVRVLLSAQTLAPGSGGVGAVARLTALSLGDRYLVEALACQDASSYDVGHVPVRAFNNRRVSFAMSNVRQSRRATHVIYDHAGTARAHVDLPLLRRPYAVWGHGWELWHQPRRDYVRALRGAEMLLVNSAYTAERAGRTLEGMTLRICPLGTFSDSPPAPRSLDVAQPTVMLLGRADELFAKGHDILIELWPRILAAVPGARLLLVGAGSALSKVKQMASASPARAFIEVTGFIADDALDSYWRRATVFAMPGFAEGFGLVYAEAMRYSLPVLASTDDGAQEVNVDGLTGFNVPRANKARIAEVLIMLLRDPSYAANLGRAGHSRWLEHYRFSAFRRRLAAVTDGFFATPAPR